MKKFFGYLLAGYLLAVGALVSTAPPSGAVDGEWLIVETSWGPGNCIMLNDPNGTHSACGGYASRTYYATAGEKVGVDPIIGDNDWVKCSISTAKGPFFTDAGTKGDGHDINCLGNLIIADMDDKVLF